MSMNRREAPTALGGLALSPFAPDRQNLASFWKSRLSDVDVAVRRRSTTP
jgi:hypothetical protein